MLRVAATIVIAGMYVLEYLSMPLPKKTNDPKLLAQLNAPAPINPKSLNRALLLEELRNTRKTLTDILKQIDETIDSLQNENSETAKKSKRKIKRINK